MTLTVYRGLPGAGKSTHAALMRAMAPDTTIVVNRDDTRRTLFGSDNQDYYECGKNELFLKETLVTEANQAAITSALKVGFDVLCTDTNLPLKRVRDLRKLAVKAGADFRVEDFSDNSLEDCLFFNSVRKDKEPVPEAVIRGMYDRFIKGGLAPLVDEVELDTSDMVPYVADRSLPDAYIFDIDGTLAHIPEGGRSPYDYSRVGEDLVDEAVRQTLWSLTESEAHIFILSGRKQECDKETIAWLDGNNIPFHHLFMRADGDDRKDWRVKYELFENIRNDYNVVGVFDDRQQVVDMWRSIGLKCFQVQPGDF